MLIPLKSRRFLGCVCCTLFVSSAYPQLPDESPQLNAGYDPVADQMSMVLSWWADSGLTYFVETTTDLKSSWTYLPFVARGSDRVLANQFEFAGRTHFLRLHHTDATYSGSPESADFDGDRVSNWDELTQGSDPFAADSHDGDVIADDWERFYGLDTTPGVDSSGEDLEPDGLTNASEFLVGTHPTRRDHPDLQLSLY